MRIICNIHVCFPTVHLSGYPSSCALELLREVDLNLVNMRAHTFMKVTQDEPIKNGGGNLKVGYLQCLSSELLSENAIIVK